MVAPTVVGQRYYSTRLGNVSGYTFFVDLPPGSAAGDLLITAVAFYGGSSLNVTPADAYLGGSDFDVRVWRRLLTAADISAAQVRFDCSGFDSAIGVSMVTLRGQNMTIDAFAVTSATNTTPSITTTKSGCLLLSAQGIRTYTSSTPQYWNSTADVTFLSPSNGNTTPNGSPSLIARRPTVSGAPGPVSWTATRWYDGGTSYNAATAAMAISGGQPPNAPTGLTVTGTALSSGGPLDRTKTIRAAWTVNDPDGNPQTAAAVRYRPAGTHGLWTTVTRSDATTFYDFPSGTFAGNVELAARTSDSDGDGTWSAPVTFAAADPDGTVSTAPVRLDPGMILALHTAQRSRRTTALGTVRAVGPLLISGPGFNNGPQDWLPAYAVNYTPVLNDTVMIERVDDQWIVTGKVVVNP